MNTKLVTYNGRNLVIGGRDKYSPNMLLYWRALTTNVINVWVICLLKGVNMANLLLKFSTIAQVIAVANDISYCIISVNYVSNRFKSNVLVFSDSFTLPSRMV